MYVLQRSIAEIEWKESRKKNVYRIGHKGKVNDTAGNVFVHVFECLLVLLVLG